MNTPERYEDIWETPAQKIAQVGNHITLTRGNTHVSFQAGKWGHIDSCVIEGVEIFHPFFGDQNKPKGGMPFMFPNAGPLSEDQKNISRLNLPQHGFGRISKWECNSETWEQRLVFSETPDFPFAGKVNLTIEITQQGSVQFLQTIQNIGDKTLPLATGLHPYFSVPKGKKDAITWDFEGWDAIYTQREIWKQGGTGKYNIPLNAPISFTIPEIGTIQLETSRDYKRFWVWSLPEKDFVCVEPVMGDEGMIVDAPFMLPPGQSHTSFLKISLKK